LALSALEVEVGSGRVGPRICLVPALGSIRLSKLTALNIDRFYISLTDRGLEAGGKGQGHELALVAELGEKDGRCADEERVHGCRLLLLGWVPGDPGGQFLERC